MNEQTVRVYAHSPLGVRLAEFDEFTLDAVVWRLETGQATLTVPYTSAKCVPANLKPGNMLYLTFDTLPDWCGVMGGVSRMANGVSVRVAEADKLLSWRYTSQESTHDARRDAIAHELLRQANQEHATLIEPGAAHGASRPLAVTYNYQPLLTALRELATGEDYQLTPFLSTGNRLRLSLDWAGQRGLDLRHRVALIHGQNVGDVTVDEQEPFYNTVIVVGAGSDWGADRPVRTAVDRDSRDKHGLRVNVLVKNDVEDADALQDIANAELAAQSRPSLHIACGSVTDEAPAGFASYREGDIVHLEALQDRGAWAYRGPVRILSRTWYPTGVCNLEVIAWQD